MRFSLKLPINSKHPQVYTSFFYLQNDLPTLSVFGFPVLVTQATHLLFVSKKQVSIELLYLLFSFFITLLKPL